MKTTPCFLILFTALASTASAKGFAAKDALRTLARERGTSLLDRIIQIGGDRGMDQPGAWHIVAMDGRGGLQEYFVGPKGIISEGKVPASSATALAGPKISQKLWTLDSTFAFMKAEAAAKKAKVGYDSANFRLRSPSPTAAPVWTLQLNNVEGQKVADVTLSASSGKVLNLTTFNPAPPPPPAPPQSSSQLALERTREVINRGAQGLGRGLNKAGGWIRSKFSPNTAAASPPATYASPRSVAQ